ncbi:MAG: hypothetical protein H6665_16700 [Ardenticatenaceae bacterium]|nr:hypothetical protein [Ardenticatenaceae bacterium]
MAHHWSPIYCRLRRDSPSVTSRHLNLGNGGWICTAWKRWKRQRLFCDTAQRYGLGNLAQQTMTSFARLRVWCKDALALEMAAAGCGHDLPTIAEIAHNLDFWSRRTRICRRAIAYAGGVYQFVAVADSRGQQLLPVCRYFAASLRWRRHAVTGASMLGLARLVDRSLVQRAHNGRYLIHELLREFARKNWRSWA